MPVNQDLLIATNQSALLGLPTTDDLLSGVGLDTLSLMVKLIAANLIAIWIYHQVLK